MSWTDRIVTSIFGRRLGLQPLTSGISGGKVFDLLVGAEAVRHANTTAETTSTNLAPYGHSYLTSAASSGVYTLDPPVPGVMKHVTFGTSGATIYMKSANSETFITTQGTSQTVLKSTQNVPFSISLVALTTASWAVIGAGSSAIMAASTTT